MKYTFSYIVMFCCLNLGISQSIILPSITSFPSGWGKNNLELTANGGLFTSKGIYSGQLNYNPIKNLSLGLYGGETRTGELRSFKSIPGPNQSEVNHNLSSLEFGGKAWYHIPMKGMYGIVTGMGYGNISSKVNEENSSEALIKAQTGSLSLYLTTTMTRTTFYLGFDWKITKINSFTAQGSSLYINNVIGNRLADHSVTRAFCPTMALNFQGRYINWGMALSGFAETTKTNLNFSSQTFHFNITVPIIRSTVKKIEAPN